MKDLPDWISILGESAIDSINSIENTTEYLSQLYPDSIAYKNVSTTYLNLLGRELVDNKVLTPNRSVLNRQAILPDEFYISRFKNTAYSLKYYNMFVHSRVLAIVEVARNYRESLVNHNLLSAFSMNRMIIEIASNFYATVKFINEQLANTPKDFKSKYQTIIDIGGKLDKKLAATRIDWKGLITGNYNNNLDKLKRSYKPEYLRQDLEADTIMKDIDKLSKKINNVRGTYEFLCEFTHPNVGLLLSYSESIYRENDNDGIPWTVRKVGTSIPDGFLSEGSESVAKIIEITDNVLIEFVNQTEIAVKDIDKVADFVKISLKEQLKHIDDLIDPYSPCPCGSGEKFKFCCKKHE